MPVGTLHAQSAHLHIEQTEPSFVIQQAAINILNEIKHKGLTYCEAIEALQQCKFALELSAKLPLDFDPYDLI